MPNQEAALSQVFSALADPTRRAVVARLGQGAAPVTVLAEPFDMSLPAVSKHLRVLERAGLLQQERNGRVRLCRLQAAPMKEAAHWLAHYQHFWTDQLDQLAAFVDRVGNHPAERQVGQPHRQRDDH